MNYNILGKHIGRAAGLLAGLAIFLGITQLLNKMYVTNDDVWYRILWHHFYEDEGKIDNLYLGSSHVYRDINPAILDKLTGKYNFNMAAPTQPLNGTYYLLREAAERNEICHVYLEMYYTTLMDDRLEQYYRNWQHTDYMEISENKIAYMLSIGGVEKLPEVMFPFIRYRKYLDDWDFVKGNLAEKEGGDYQNYKYESKDGNEFDIICRQGYYDTNRNFKDENRCLKSNIDLRENPMGGESEKYCRRIIEYCQKNEIPITLFVSPISELQLVSTFDYDNYINEVRKLAKEYDVEFYDFNLTKEEYLPLQEDRDYKDSGHLNRYGAELFTNFFYEVVFEKGGGR